MAPETVHTVVVVEDDPAIRDLVKATLEDEDFGVVEAASADQALQILERDAANVQVLFTDINTGGNIDGRDLAAIAERIWPHIAIIVTSGRPAVPVDSLPRTIRFIRKPYDLGEVVRHVRDMALGASR